LRSVALALALDGAKSFDFFSYNDLYRNDFEETWPVVCRVAQMLRDLEPFILSDVPSGKPKMRVTAGQVRAALFRAEDGDRAVMIVSGGPKAGSTVLRFSSAGDFRSVYGASTLGTDGWTFEADGIGSDLLITN